MSAIVLRFPAPESRVPSLNDSEHWSVERSRRLLWQQAAYYAAVAHKPRPRGLPCCVVAVEFPFVTRRRRDPHNFTLALKWLIDGLVHAEVWPDDTSEYVATTEPVLNVGGTEVVLTLTPKETV